MNTTKVVVIGTGPSGIAAATKLLELGFEKVHLVEAENRIGGRIHTVPFGDNVIDLGAQWCHGQKDNVVYELANKENLLGTSVDMYTNADCVRSNKELVAREVSDRFQNIVDKILVQADVELLTYKGSFGSYFNDQFWKALEQPENTDINRTIAKEFFETYQKIQCSLEASDSLNDVSAKSYTEFWDSEGDKLLNWKGKGYIEFLRLLMKSAEKGTELGVLNQRVILAKPVKQINWSNDSESVQVKCKDNEVIEADHVIVTVSLGVLKEKHLSLFEPKLPADKVRAIEGIAFGTINDIYVEFPTQFWPQGWTGFNLLWREEEIKEIRNTDRAWLLDIFAFNIVNFHTKALCGWIIGASGRHMETLSEDEISSGCMYIFRKFLKWDIPTPVRIKTSAWFKNENFKGSYSYRSPMTEELNAKASELASPLLNSDQKPVVLFAGEATSDHHFATVHGAVETGWREAQRLAKLYDSTKPKQQ